jgi:hypothetical protein
MNDDRGITPIENEDASPGEGNRDYIPVARTNEEPIWLAEAGTFFNGLADRLMLQKNESIQVSATIGFCTPAEEKQQTPVETLLLQGMDQFKVLMTLYTRVVEAIERYEFELAAGFKHPLIHRHRKLYFEYLNELEKSWVAGRNANPELMLRVSFHAYHNESTGAVMVLLDCEWRRPQCDGGDDAVEGEQELAKLGQVEFAVNNIWLSEMTESEISANTPEAPVCGERGMSYTFNGDFMVAEYI